MKKNNTPASFELNRFEYEKLIQKNTVEVYRKYTEPEREYENGKQKDLLYDDYVEIRKLVDHPATNNLYIYSTFTHKLWVTVSLHEANSIVNKEWKYCNEFMKRINESARKDSIKKAKEKPASLAA